MRDLITCVGPQTLLSPASAIALAYTDGTLTKGRLLEAIDNRELPHYRIADKSLVTLADLSDFVKGRHGGASSVNGVLGNIYFIGFRRWVKIGFTFGPISVRMQALQTSAPEPLDLLASLYGTLATERNLHQRFHRHRAHGEWFHLSRSIRHFIAKTTAAEWSRAMFNSTPVSA